MNITRWALLCCVAVITGCQSTHEQLVAQGYPPFYADGYQDGCGSGRQAGGAMTGQFKKDVPRYMSDKLYAEGWTDGFRQCQAELESRDRLAPGGIMNDRDRAWEQQKTQGMGRAYKPN